MGTKTKVEYGRNPGNRRAPAGMVKAILWIIIAITTGMMIAQL